MEPIKIVGAHKKKLKGFLAFALKEASHSFEFVIN